SLQAMMSITQTMRHSGEDDLTGWSVSSLPRKTKLEIPSADKPRISSRAINVALCQAVNLRATEWLPQRSSVHGQRHESQHGCATRIRLSPQECPECGLLRPCLSA